MADLYTSIAAAIIDGNPPRAKELVSQALADGMPAEEILSQGLIVGMTEVGKRFKNNEMFLPEVMASAAAMHEGLNILQPVLAASKHEDAGTIVIGTVKGDVHDIGKNLVAMMLRGAGFKVVDIGIDTDPEKFIQAAQENKAQIVAMSALLTTTMPAMKKTIETFSERGVRGKYKIIVGGAPVTDEYARSIGADGYAPDAARAVDLARSLIS